VQIENDRTSSCNVLNERTAARMPTIRLGLPHLGLHGLSENWVLRECGHKHWNAIAAALERTSESTVDRNGNRLYAPIFALTVRGPIRNFHEGDEVEMSLNDSGFVSASRYYSSQIVKNQTGTDAVIVDLLSVFVRRKKCGDNQSLFPSFPSRLPQSRKHTYRANSDVGNIDLSLRTAKNGFADSDDDSAHFEYVYSPSPIADFNAAGVFYFAEYPPLIDRAEWLLYRDLSLLRPKTLERQIAYFGSPNLGEDLRVELFPVQSRPEELRHIARVSEASSHRLLARAYTSKKFTID
jgi:probable biosynthetic protein (TIGR04099 family)